MFGFPVCSAVKYKEVEIPTTHVLLGRRVLGVRAAPADHRVLPQSLKTMSPVTGDGRQWCGRKTEPTCTTLGAQHRDVMRKMSKDKRTIGDNQNPIQERLQNGKAEHLIVTVSPIQIFGRAVRTWFGMVLKDKEGKAVNFVSDIFITEVHWNLLYMPNLSGMEWVVHQNINLTKNNKNI